MNKGITFLIIYGIVGLIIYLITLLECHLDNKLMRLNGTDKIFLKTIEQAMGTAFIQGTLWPLICVVWVISPAMKKCQKWLDKPI